VDVVKMLAKLSPRELAERLGARPRRAPFRERPNPTEALAMDRSLFASFGKANVWNIVQPSAYGMYFDVPAPMQFDPKSILDGGIAVLNLQGPIGHHSDWWWCNYEDLAMHIRCALEHGDVRAAVLKIDSPGGVAAGMQESHKAIRRMRKEFGKPIFAYVDEMACSAAYHVASACTEIWMPGSAIVGSVGVIMCTVDESEALDKAGIKVRYVVTGKRKADLHPGQPVTDDVLRVAQEKVDAHGRMFFDAVGKARAHAGLDPKRVESYQAAVFLGSKAIGAGLADGLASYPRFLSLVRASLDAKTNLVKRP